MKVIPGPLAGILIIEPDIFRDDRGWFVETWSAKRYSSAGVPEKFVQDNITSSRKGVLRGLHFQNPLAQGKLITAVDGEIFDVAVDLRVGSPTFGKWYGEMLSGETRRQLFIPPGFAHGFVVKSDSALVQYKCTEYYHRESEKTLLWNDPDLGIDWTISNPITSEKDQRGRRLRDLRADELFRF